MAAAKLHRTFRVHQHDLDRIDELARTHHMTRNEYIVSVSTGQMPAQRSEAIERLERLEERMDRVEAAAFQTSDTW